MSTAPLDFVFERLGKMHEWGRVAATGGTPLEHFLGVGFNYHHGGFSKRLKPLEVQQQWALISMINAKREWGPIEMQVLLPRKVLLSLTGAKLLSNNSGRYSSNTQALVKCHDGYTLYQVPKYWRIWVTGNDPFGQGIYLHIIAPEIVDLTVNNDDDIVW